MKILLTGQANGKVMCNLHFVNMLYFPILDDNECTDGSQTCDGNATCTNTPGSFMCACNSGYSGDGYTEGTGCTGKKFHLFL